MISGLLFAAFVALIFVTMRRRGRAEQGMVPQSRWRPTDEVISDPETGRLIRVWIDPSDGSRHHVPDGPPGAVGRAVPYDPTGPIEPGWPRTPPSGPDGPREPERGDEPGSAP
jgi:hypothetical protein